MRGVSMYGWYSDSLSRPCVMRGVSMYGWYSDSLSGPCVMRGMSMYVWYSDSLSGPRMMRGVIMYGLAQWQTVWALCDERCLCIVGTVTACLGLVWWEVCLCMVGTVTACLGLVWWEVCICMVGTVTACLGLVWCIYIIQSCVCVGKHSLENKTQIFIFWSYFSFNYPHFSGSYCMSHIEFVFRCK